MDYKNALKLQLLSKSNVDFLVNTILNHFKVSNKAINKCINIITNNLSRYLDNIEIFPKNNEELIQAIHFLNKKCFDDFTIYLSTKYPNINLFRGNINQSTFIQDTSDNKQENDNNMEEIIILSEDEKNKLLKQYNIVPQIGENFLSYLTDPMVLQLFNMMIGQTNNVKEPEIIFDDILTKEDVQQLLSISKNNDNKLGSDDNDKKIEPDTNDKNSEDEITIDLANLTTDALHIILKRIEEIAELKNNYLSQNNLQMVQDLDDEKMELINAVKEYKEKLANESTENQDKIQTLTMTYNNNRPNDDPKVDYLDLKIDPTNDYTDLKNILIKFKSDKKIVDITLVDYYLPLNGNNVTRFNNIFQIYTNNRLERILIPPNKYDINVLLAYLQNQLSYLEFNINDKKLITIQNTLGMKFDLVIGSDTIFQLLGFSGSASIYKDKLFYTASDPYDVESNQTILFNLSGTQMEPIELEFNKQITINKSLLRKSRSGIAMKQMVLSYKDRVGHFYDFIMPIKMCFKITYC